MITRFVIAVSTAALLLTSCAQQAETPPADVNLTVDMKEYSITLSVPTVKAGLVKIAIRNLGSMVHDFDLIKTDLAPDKLPMDTVAAKAKADGLVKQMTNIAAGRVTTLSADLQPGHYVIICNVAGHYQLGMRTELKVE